MLAALYMGNGQFKIEEKSSQFPQKGEVKIKVAFCGICGTDIHIYHGKMDERIPTPMVIGHEMSGTIEQIGTGVVGFDIGDKVVVRPLDNRGEQPSDKGYSHICKNLKFIGIDSPGAMQEYWNVPAFVLHKLPKQMDLKIAALVEPLAVACHDVRLAQLKVGETAVVLGGGPIGLLIAMVAKEVGAKVILSEVNPIRCQLAKKLGFTVVNPNEEDLLTFVKAYSKDYLADVVFEVAGVQSTIDKITEITGIRGRIVLVAIHSEPRPVNLFQFFWKELQLIGARVYEKEDFENAIQLMNSQKLPLDALVTSVKPLSNIQSAFEEIDQNPAGMKLLLDVQK